MGDRGRSIPHSGKHKPAHHPYHPKLLLIIKTLPMMTGFDDILTLEEVGDVIEALSNRKAPGSDRIPPEVIKCGKPVLTKHLHDFVCTCGEEGFVPQDLHDVSITTLQE